MNQRRIFATSGNTIWFHEQPSGTYRASVLNPQSPDDFSVDPVWLDDVFPPETVMHLTRIQGYSTVQDHQ